VIVVEDIVDTELTAQFLMQQLTARQAKSVKLCALLHEPARSLRPVPIDYLGFTIDDVLVVGYGLDSAQRYRNLPGSCVIESQAASRDRLRQLGARPLEDRDVSPAGLRTPRETRRRNRQRPTAQTARCEGTPSRCRPWVGPRSS
jgi:hypothetical protein